MCYHITVANVPFAPHSCSIRGAVTALHAGAACKISTVLLHDAKTRQDKTVRPSSHKLACTQPEIATILLSRFQYLTSTHCCVFHYYQRRLRFSFKLCEVKGTYIRKKRKFIDVQLDNSTKNTTLNMSKSGHKSVMCSTDTKHQLITVIQTTPIWPNVQKSLIDKTQ